MPKSLMPILLFTALLIAIFPGWSFADNLIRNGGFEKTTSDGAPAGWQVNKGRGAEAEIVLDDTEKHSGKYAYKIDIAPPGGRITLSLDDDAIDAPKSGQAYQLAFWVNSKNMDYNQFFVAPAVRLNFRPSRISPMPTIDLMSAMQGVEGWKKLTLNVRAPEDAEELYMNIILTKGTVWLDDFSITPRQ